MINVFHYIKSAYAELSKTTWPSRDTIIRHTLLVILAIAVATIFVGLIDGGLAFLIRFILER